MVKKILAAILLIALLLSAVSCIKSGNQGQETETKDDDGDSRYSVLSSKKYNGATYSVLCAAEQWKEAYVVEDQSDVLSSAKYNMYNKIIDRYDIKIDHVLFNGFEAGLARVSDAIRASVSTGSLDYDLYVGGMGYVYPRVVDGVLFNLDNTGIDFTQPWWCQYVNDELRLGNIQPLASGYYGLTNISHSRVMFYNPTVAETYHLEDIYDIVDRGEWTYEEMFKMCKAVMTDKNGDGEYKLTDDVIGIGAAENALAHLLVSFNYDLTIHNEDGTISLNSNLEKLFEITNRMHDLVDDERKNGYSQDDTKRTGLFAEGHALLMYDTLAYADKEEIRNMEDYTIIPACKYDSQQKEYITDVSSDLCGIPLNVKDYDMSEDVMEALACYSYYELKDVYLNLVLKDKYSKDENMERMIDLCLEHPKTEFSYMASYIFGTELFFCTIWNGRNLAAWMQTHKRVYEAKFEELYDTLIENYN